MNFHFFRKVKDLETGRVLNSCGMLPSFHMDCGPSGAETNIASGAQSLSNTLSTAFGQRFQNQNDLISQLNSSLSPILAAGPGQQGYTPQEAAAISTATINSNAAANRNARQAAQTTLAGRGDGSGLASGVDKQILGSIASSSANNLANQQTANTVANYEKGNQNYWRAQGAVNSLAGLENPEAFGSEAISGSNAAFADANQIQQQKNQEQAAIAGGITSLASNIVLPGVAGGINAAPGQSFMSGFFGGFGGGK
jgi:hypothetical protein